MVYVATDHIEVSVHQDVAPNSEKREIRWHPGLFFYSLNSLQELIEKLYILKKAELSH